MRPTHTSAFLASLALHGAAVGLVVFLTFYAAHRDSTPPVIFELVAGPPTAPDELIAPALGNSRTPVRPDPVKVAAPPPVKPETPAAEQAKPEPPATKEALAPPATKPKPEAKPVDPAKAIVRSLKSSERTSYREYLKKHPIPKEPPPQPGAKSGRTPRIDTEGIAGGAQGGSTANKRGGGDGKALTREEQSELNTYISFLINALRDAHEPPPGVSDRLETKVTFDISASGNILNPRITRPSGNPEFDESALAAFRRVNSIGPLPNGKADTWTLTFRMRDQD